MRHSISAIILSLFISSQALANMIEYTDKIELNENDFYLDSVVTVKNTKTNVLKHSDQNNFSVKIKLKSSSFIIDHPNDELLAQYNNLTEIEKIKFHKKRFAALKILSSGLSMIRRGFGFGSVIKEKIIFWKEKNQDSTTFQERSDAIVEGLIRAFDKMAWQSAPVFSDLKEVGFTGTGQIVAALGNNKKLDMKKQIARKNIRVAVPEIKTGGTIGLGISVGINFEQKSLIFQIFNVNERLSEVYLPLVYLAGNLKTGLYISSSQEKLYKGQGSAFYPFMAPGYTESTPDKKSFGTTWAFGIPTTPIDAGLSFKTDLNETSYLSFKISPFTWKFISVSARNPFSIIKIAVQNIPKVISEVRALSQQLYYVKACKGMFL